MCKFKRKAENALGRVFWPLKIERKTRHSKERLEAYIVEKMHSIEKGLSVEKPKFGFGQQPIKKLFDYMHEYVNRGYDSSSRAFLMAGDSLESYLDFHRRNNFSNDTTKWVDREYQNIKKNIPAHHQAYGGTLQIDKKDMDFNLDEIRKLFLTRHSVRDFSPEDIEEDRLKEAIELAMRAPSACNRQGARIYVIGKSKFPMLKGYLQGVGGFEDSLNKMLIITGKVSSYHPNERYQYIVSASILAGYLTLTLHALGIGCCLIQRQVQWHGEWAKIAREFDIPEDEQIICMAGLGMLKDSFQVPASARYEFERIARFVN